MPLALVGLLAICFSRHPRLSKAPGSAWLLATFALIALALWMLSVGPSPVRLLEFLPRKIPVVLLLFSLMTFVVFSRRNSDADDDLHLNLSFAISFLLLGWIVAYLSGGKGGADPMVQFVMDRFGLTASQAHIAIIAVRKTIHFTFYGLIGWTSYRLADPRFDLRKAVAFGLLVAFSFAVFDEFHQSTTTNRTGSVWDVGLDMLGATTLIGFSVIRYRRRLQPSGSREGLLG